MKNILRNKKIRYLSISIAVVVFLMIAVFLAFDEPLPTGIQGDRAEQLARRLEESVRIAEWKETGAVEWTFRETNHHLWDRKRDFVRVRWDDTEVLVDLDTRTGVAFSGGKRVSEARAEKLVADAYEYWANDSFWLNPIAKLRDKGVSLSVVQMRDVEDNRHGEGLLVSYSSGGVTPGDSYLWILDSEGTPVAWRMWVSILPIGGLEATYEDWQQLSTGALVSTTHRLPLGLTLRLSDIRGAKNLGELESGPDPFQLLERDEI